MFSKILLYGDSHSAFSFKGLRLPHAQYSSQGVTMYRIGRDQTIPRYNAEDYAGPPVLACVTYGEVDCRCHIHRQRLAGRDEDTVIADLVDRYIQTVTHTLANARAVIVTAVIPPTRRADYESLNGPIRHEFPFVGTDEERVRYTRKVNAALEAACAAPRTALHFFDPYGPYTRDDGTLRYEYSDQTVHLGPGHNDAFLAAFTALVAQLG